MNTRNTFDRFYGKGSPSFDSKPSPELVHLVNRTARRGKALDLGCGDGRNALFLAEAGYDVTAVDYSENGIRKLERFAGQRGCQARINAVVANVTEFDLRPESYDLIAAVTILDHLEQDDMETVFARSVSGVRPGGFLFIKVHTVRDPGFRGDKAKASEMHKAIRHYFKTMELYEKLNEGMAVLGYVENEEIDDTHGETHYHHFAKGLAMKAEKAT